MDSAAKGVARTKSGKLEKAAAEPLPLMGAASHGGPDLSRSRSFGQRLLEAGHCHLRKTLSGQLRMGASEEGGGSAGLSRAAPIASLSQSSSPSLSFSYTFTGFTAFPEDTVNDNRAVSDDEDGIDLEAGDASRENQMAQPTFPICLKFTEVRYSVLVKGITKSSEKQILKGITGSARPGELLALMGPSGSGKTTLLGLLGGRITGNIIQGSITYNDEPYTRSLKRRIGFVTQDDVLHAHLTVKETLTYAALLRLPRTMSRREKDERTMSIIYELGLERCKDTVIGGAFVRGVSGGERKRVSIGIEIIINPSLLFLDEPTSGLDSTTALRIIKVLHGMAKETIIIGLSNQSENVKQLNSLGLLNQLKACGKNVVTTVHQPSSRLFHRFDKLILLGKGSLLYYGKASKAMDYFSSIGCSPLIAMNPPEFLLDVSTGNLRDVTTPSKLEDKLQAENLGGNTRNGKPSPEDMQEYLVEAYQTRAADKQKKRHGAPAPITEELKVTASSPGGDRGASWWQQYSILFLRGLKERKYDYLSWLKVIQVLAMSAITSLLWWHSTSTSLADDRAGLLFFISVFWGYIPVYLSIFTFPQEKQMLIKERAVDMYKLSAYFMATTTSDLSLNLILPLMFLLIVYFTTGLRCTVVHFFLTALIVFLDIVAAQGLGLAISASVMDIKKSATLGSVITLTFMLSGGFFVQRVPTFMAWLRYASFNYHAYKLLLKVQYDDLPRSLNVASVGNGVKEVLALLAMGFAYRLVAYICLRRMKLQN